MSRRRYSRRGRSSTLDDALAPAFGLICLGIVGFILTHQQQILLWGFVALLVCLAVAVAVFVYKKRKRNAALNWDDDKILRMLKGGTPAQFEEDTAKMFQAPRSVFFAQHSSLLKNTCLCSLHSLYRRVRPTTNCNIRRTANVLNSGARKLRKGPAWNALTKPALLKSQNQTIW